MSTVHSIYAVQRFNSATFVCTDSYASLPFQRTPHKHILPAHSRLRHLQRNIPRRLLNLRVILRQLLTHAFDIVANLRILRRQLFGCDSQFAPHRRHIHIHRQRSVIITIVSRAMNPHRSRSRSAGNIPLSAAHHILVAHYRVNNDAHPRRAPISDMRRTAHLVNHIIAITLIDDRHTVALNPHPSLHSLARAVNIRIATAVFFCIYRQHRRINHYHSSILAILTRFTIHTRFTIRSVCAVSSRLAVFYHGYITRSEHVSFARSLGLELQRFHAS